MFPPKLSLSTKLFLALLATTAAVVIAMALSVRWSFERGFREYLHNVELEQLDTFVETLEDYYGRAGSWQSLYQNHELWRRLLRNTLDEGPPTQGRFPPPPRRRPPSGGNSRLGEYDFSAPPHPRPHRRDFPPPGRDAFPDDRGDFGGPHRPPPRDFEGGGRQRFRPPPFAGEEILAFGPRLRLLDQDREPVIGRPEAPPEETLLPIARDNVTIGWVGLRPAPIVTDKLALSFQAQQSRTYLLIATLTVLVSALVSLLLARQLLAPVKRIAAGAKELAAGRYDTRIRAHNHDELGRLANDFNTLAKTLERNELARRQWIADISHELRTPLAVLRGEIEALEDGVREITTERLKSLSREVQALAKLVDDLYQLALSDLGALDYRKEPIDAGDILEDVIRSFQTCFTEKNIQLTHEIRAQRGASVFADPRRLTQLLTNLFGNSLRYTDPGGRLEVVLEADENSVIIDLQDSTPGVPDAALGRLFERLYRVDKSRSRALGGAGLGLAICKNIVDAHDGKITAEHSALGGLRIRIWLPRGSG